MCERVYIYPMICTGYVLSQMDKFMAFCCYFTQPRRIDIVIITDFLASHLCY